MTASTAITPFNFNTNAVRVVMRDGDPWFSAKDVMTALGYSGHSAPAKVCDHIPEDWKGVNQIHTLGGVQKMLCLSEPGLYFFLGRSDKPTALPFQKWLAGEVLPAIRKTGRYEVQPTAPTNVDSDRMKLAMDGAAAIAAKVQSEAFAQLLNHGKFSMDRWMLFFNFTNEGAKPEVKRIESNACIMSPEDVLKNAYKGMHIDPDVVHDFVIESIGRMRQRTEFYKARSAQGQLSL